MSGSQATLLNCLELKKSFGALNVVKGVSFEIHPGECVGVIGPNGAGKTTILKMCLGQLSPDAGQVRAFDAIMPKDALFIKNKLGVVSQFDTLDPDFTCVENLEVFGAYFGLSKKVLAQRIPKLLEFSALTPKAQAKPGDLSGGMRRRLSLARALINDPQLLLLDEPTTGLDPQARHLMWERLQSLVREGKSILLTTHFMDEAERLCDRLIVLDQGQKIAQGTPKDLIEEHLEKNVIEVFSITDKEPLMQKLAAHAQRVEDSGETVFFYADDPSALLHALSGMSDLRTLHRPANLEDLFLKLTGRQIREGA
jgi:lipooligosaccharide transport system ATP-binding protein